MKKFFVYFLLLFDILGLLYGCTLTVVDAYHRYQSYKEYESFWGSDVVNNEHSDF